MFIKEFFARLMLLFACSLLSTNALAEQAYNKSIIVRLDDLSTHTQGVNAVQTLLSEYLKNQPLLSGLKVKERVSREFWLFDVPQSYSDAELLQLARKIEKEISGVLSARPNRIFRAHRFNDPAWESIQKPNLRRSDAAGYDDGIAQLLESNPEAGANTTVAIVDTGRLPHQEMNGKISNEVNFGSISDASDKANSTAGLNSACDESDRENLLHGIQMGSIAVAQRNNSIGMVGMSAGNSYSIRSLSSCRGSGTEVQIARGILWAAGLDMDDGENFVAQGFPRNDTAATVINLSLGTTPLPDEQACPSGSLMHTVIQRAIAAGSVVVASAGNEYSFQYLNGELAGQRVGTRLSDPANCEGVVSVGSLDFEGFHASYSNIPADSERLVTSVVTGATTNDGTYQVGDNERYSRGVGTSQAAAKVSGVLASVLSLAGANRPSNEDLLNLIASSGQVFNSSDGVCSPATRDCGTRLNAISLLEQLGSVANTQVPFIKTFGSATLNMTNIGTVLDFVDSEGGSDNLQAFLLENGRRLKVDTQRAGRFFLRVASSDFVSEDKPSDFGLYNLVANQAGDLAISLINTARTEVSIDEFDGNAGSFLSASNLVLLDGRYDPISSIPPYLIKDGRLFFDFRESTQASFELDIVFGQSNVSTQSRATRQTNSQKLLMQVTNGRVTILSQPQSTTPQQTPSPAVGGGTGGGGALTGIGLVTLAVLFGLLKIAQKRKAKKLQHAYQNQMNQSTCFRYSGSLASFAPKTSNRFGLFQDVEGWEVASESIRAAISKRISNSGIRFNKNKGLEDKAWDVFQAIYPVLNYYAHNGATHSRSIELTLQYIRKELKGQSEPVMTNPLECHHR